ncbi:DUF58 domain-containing protein [Kineococcus sp. TBRC 1896]|uniref:DUF58 domain-containing protein n=1 Tax=Kineococcus mangrovi TaxID=1660183 RepID=A0ABV4I911_9ACTN
MSAAVPHLPAGESAVTEAVSPAGVRWRRVALVTAGPALLVLSVGVGNRWLTLVGCLLLAAVGLASLTAPVVGALTVAVQRPARVGVGDVVEHVVRVRNTGSRTSPPLVLHLGGDVLSPAHAGVPGLEPGQVVVLRVPRSAPVRGAGGGTEVVLEWADALGVVLQRRRAVVPAPVHVHPAPAAVPVLPGPAARAGADDVAGVRPFRRGDAGGAVHWRASARRGSGPGGPALVVVEREALPVGLRVVVLPAPGETTGAEFEAVLGQAAAVVLADVAAGRRVGVLGADGAVREGLAALDVLAVARPCARSLGAAVEAAGPDGEVVLARAGGWRRR